MEPKMDYKIKDKRALVIGASKGLGAASAKFLAEEGVEVVAAARNTDKISQWAKGLKVTPYQLDLTKNIVIVKDYIDIPNFKKVEILEFLSILFTFS